MFRAITTRKIADHGELFFHTYLQMQVLEVWPVLAGTLLSAGWGVKKFWASGAISQANEGEAYGTY
jgi:hypothetical protein